MNFIDYSTFDTVNQGAGLQKNDKYTHHFAQILVSSITPFANHYYRFCECLKNISVCIYIF